jgi:hypothetical protein
MTLDLLRSRLDALEGAVQLAGDALFAAEESGAGEADVTRLLRAYGIHGRTKLGWLRDGGELLRWHRGEAPRRLAHDLAHQCHPAEVETQIQ